MTKQSSLTPMLIFTRGNGPSAKKAFSAGRMGNLGRSAGE